MRGIRIQNLLLLLFIFLLNLTKISAQWTWPLLLFGGELGEILFEPVDRSEKTPQQRRAFNKLFRSLIEPSMNNRGPGWNNNGGSWNNRIGGWPWNNRNNRGGGWLWSDNMSRDWGSFGKNTADTRFRNEKQKAAYTGKNSVVSENSINSKTVKNDNKIIKTTKKDSVVNSLNINKNNSSQNESVTSTLPKYLGSRKFIQSVDVKDQSWSSKSLGSRRKTIADFMELDRIGNALNSFGVYKSLNALDTSRNTLSAGSNNGVKSKIQKEKPTDKKQKISIKFGNSKTKSSTGKTIPGVSNNDAANKAKGNFTRPSVNNRRNQFIANTNKSTRKRKFRKRLRNKIKSAPPRNQNTIVKGGVSTNSLSSPKNSKQKYVAKDLIIKENKSFMSRLLDQIKLQGRHYPRPPQLPPGPHQPLPNLPKRPIGLPQPPVGPPKPPVGPPQPPIGPPQIASTPTIAKPPKSTTTTTQTPETEVISEIPETTTLEQGEYTEPPENNRPVGRGFNFLSLLGYLFGNNYSPNSLTTVGSWGSRYGNAPTTEGTAGSGWSDPAQAGSGWSDPAQDWKISAREEASELATDKEGIWNVVNATKSGPVDQMCTVYKISYQDTAVIVETEGDLCSVVISWHERPLNNQPGVNTQGKTTVFEPVVAYVNQH